MTQTTVTQQVEESTLRERVTKSEKELDGKNQPKTSTRVKYDPRYWVVHGKTYDLTPFVEKHPGGAYIIQLGKGRDCTEMYESVHAFAKGGMNIPNQILAKYEVKDAEPKPKLFAWNEDGFYSVLRERVRKRFEGRNEKATTGVFIKLAVMMVLYVYAWSQACLTGNWYWAILSGTLTEMIGFCLMHDSSHNAVSKNPTINYMGTWWSSWMFWNNWVWLQHHCYGHHSYTGIFAKDPDVHNAELFVRKNERTKKKKSQEYQPWYSWILFLVLPNQHVGQILLYQLFSLVMGNRLFGVSPLIRGPDYVERDSRIVMFLSFLFHIVFPLCFQSVGTVFLLLALHYTMMGISYFLNVAPNHDTVNTHKNHPDLNIMSDWGEHQVRTTGNHSISNSWLDYAITNLWGGMNYQIEHHLFPTLNHAHYHEVSLIVQDTCKEFGIHYNTEGSWLSSLKGFYQLITYMSTAPWKRREPRVFLS